MTIDAPFPYFGGKKKVAPIIWAALGDVDHYIEPFFGSGATLLQRPHVARLETVNDMDGLLANFWRAVRADPDAVAHAADWPCNEADLHARHLWLVGQRERITERLMGDPDWFDAKLAGWWVWGACNWIGGGWCSGAGPWVSVDGVMTDSRQLPHLGNAGRGVNRKLPHLGDAGRGDFIREWFAALSDRLRGVRVACGGWQRVCGPSVRNAGGSVCGVFLDPPYDIGMRANCYAIETSVAGDVLQWCQENGNEAGLRIVLAGYDGEHNVLENAHGWRSVAWKTQGGYAMIGDGRGRENSAKERIWLSPHCVDTATAPSVPLPPSMPCQQEYDL